jgi:hypothetical protein
MSETVPRAIPRIRRYFFSPPLAIIIACNEYRLSRHPWLDVSVGSHE